VKNSKNTGNRSTGSDRTGSGPVVELYTVRSKSACIQQQAVSLEKMSKDFDTSVSNQKEFIVENRIGARLKNLKLLMDSGVLSREEFSKHARVAAGINFIS
jgi:hypothetical protein